MCECVGSAKERSLPPSFPSLLKLLESALIMRFIVSSIMRVCVVLLVTFDAWESVCANGDGMPSRVLCIADFRGRERAPRALRARSRTQPPRDYLKMFQTFLHLRRPLSNVPATKE